MRIAFHLNGEQTQCDIMEGAVLADVLRDTLLLTGTKIGCREGECGACTVLLDGEPVNACMILAETIEGRQITTIEGLRGDPAAKRLMELLAEGGGSQCGFCTPGMVVSGYALIRNNTHLSDQAIREGMAGNLCRCTGYAKIIEAVKRCKEELG